MQGRDQWGFQKQAYLEIGSYHGRNPDDPWLEYRLPDGTFKTWLHTWCYVTDPPPNKGRGVMLGRPWSPLPWTFEVPPDGELLTSMFYTGYTKKLPGEWRRFTPPGKEQESYLNGKIYG